MKKSNLNTVEIKAFVPSKDFQQSKEFYQKLGFTLASDNEGIAYFHFGEQSFLLQDFYEAKHCQNFMMHLLVEDADAWHQMVIESGVLEQFDCRVTELEDQPWQMRDFCLIDPSGVLWRIGQNI